MNQKKLELVILSTFLISLVLLALTLAYLNERKNRIDKMLITSSSGSKNVAGGPQLNQKNTNVENASKGNGAIKRKWCT